MRKITTYLLLAMLALPVLAFTSLAQAEIVRIEFNVAAMSGLTDQYKVRKILASLEGVQRVILTDDDELVSVIFDDEANSLFDIKTALAAQGYPATKIKVIAK